MTILASYCIQRFPDCNIAHEISVKPEKNINNNRKWNSSLFLKKLTPTWYKNLQIFFAKQPQNGTYTVAPSYPANYPYDLSTDHQNRKWRRQKRSEYGIRINWEQYLITFWRQEHSSETVRHVLLIGLCKAVGH
jgi:hypothetical protein